MAARTRPDKDALGVVQVPVWALYGAHTARAVENFAVSDRTLGDYPELIHAALEVKAAAARANADLNALPIALANAIVAATEQARDVGSEHYPINILAGGTATNMNVNEVLANLANERLGGGRGSYRPIHPNDHVNRSQSSNDVYPTAVHVALMRLGQTTLADLDGLRSRLDVKATEYYDVERLGRTDLQDALPISIHETHVAQAHSVARVRSQLAIALADLHEVPLGGTAIGTGEGAPLGFGRAATTHLATETGLPLRQAEDLVDAVSNLDGYLALANALVAVMTVVGKIAQDIRLLSSGPKGGFGELLLPTVQVGSSMMPHKVNPVIPGIVIRVSYEVLGRAVAVQAAVSAGELELNVMAPVATKALIDSLKESSRAIRIFSERCVADMHWDLDVVSLHRNASLREAVQRAIDSSYEVASHESGEEKS